MSQKKILIIAVTLYGMMASVFFVKNVVLAREESVLQEVFEKEDIQDEEARSTLRAFYTAPPVIPHEIESQDSKDCLRCHLEVKKLEDGRVAMATPHPQFSSCLQCHVPGQTDVFKESRSEWKGLEEPRRGDRWFVTSPPTVPHRIRMRENCLTCHGPENPDMRLRTTHPERTNCLQCHVPDYTKKIELDQE